MLPVVAAQPATAAGSDLFFSEYVEGGGYNKAIEVFNGTGGPVDLTGYEIELYSNGSASPSDSYRMSGTLADGDVFVVASSQAGEPLSSIADATSGAINWNGDDAVALVKGTEKVDVIGRIGSDPGSYWGTGSVTTQDHTLRRKGSVTAGDPDGTDAFDPATEWDGYAKDTFDGLGTHTTSGPAPDSAPSVKSTDPANNNTEVAPTEDLTVTFSEPVTAEDGAFTLACDASPVAMTVSGGDTSYTLDPDSELPPGASCTLTVHADKVVDQDGDRTPMATDKTVTFSTADCGADYTPAYAIQGAGDTSPEKGKLVATEGIVVGDYEKGGLDGFYLQDPAGDDKPETSDAVFVFNPDQDEVSTGDLVRVFGRVSEYHGQTQVGAFDNAVTVCGNDTVPAPEPTEVRLPFTDVNDPERYEGMLVTLPQTLTVTELYQLGRFGQVTLSSGGRLPQPTNVALPGSQEAKDLQDLNDRNRIIVDDASQRQNPDPIVWARDGKELTAQNTLRGGDTVEDVVGVMTYTWGGNSASPDAWRVRPEGALGGAADFQAVNERTTSPEKVGGTMKVASFNVLNYFDDFSRCRGGVGPDAESVDCRGADNQAELDRQAAKTVAAIKALDADVVGLLEIENDGYGPDSALADLVGRLNAELGAGTYRYLDVDARTEQVDALGNDAIKVAMIYQPGEVVPNGDTGVLNTDSFVNGDSGEPRNRPALAQTFMDRATGGRVTLAVNHLKSKGSSCAADGDPEDPDGQGNCNQTRVDSARELVQWLDSRPTGMKEDDRLIMGDLNSYAMEDPIRAIEDGGYTNLVEKYEGEDAYSDVFDGQWGYLDHALASDSLVGQVTGVTTWHINADEPSVLDYNTDFKSADQVEELYAPTPYRSSDHDPVVVGLKLHAD
ncbi:MAG: ExeM/NucH family extracellular endonuclease [Nocardioides sp.]